MKDCNNKFLLGLAFCLLFVVLLPIFYLYFLVPTNNNDNIYDIKVVGNLNFREEFLTDVGITFGHKDAKVVIEEFYSVGCGACQYLHPVIKKIKEEYIDTGHSVRLVKVDFPIDIPSMQAVVIARSSNDNQKYLEYMDYLLENPGEWMPYENVDEILWKIAQKFFNFSNEVMQQKKAMSSEVADYIYNIKDTFIGNRVIKHLPTLFINGKIYSGPRDYESLKKEIDRLLMLGG